VKRLSGTQARQSGIFPDPQYKDSRIITGFRGCSPGFWALAWGLAQGGGF
jgi:hypothetical protein